MSSESTTLHERANVCESTIIDERATSQKSTISRERFTLAFLREPELPDDPSSDWYTFVEAAQEEFQRVGSLDLILHKYIRNFSVQLIEYGARKMFEQDVRNAVQKAAGLARASAKQTKYRGSYPRGWGDVDSETFRKQKAADDASSKKFSESIVSAMRTEIIVNFSKEWLEAPLKDGRGGVVPTQHAPVALLRHYMEQKQAHLAAARTDAQDIVYFEKAISLCEEKHVDTLYEALQK